MLIMTQRVSSSILTLIPNFAQISVIHEIRLLLSLTRSLSISDSAKGGKGSRAANKVNTAAPIEPLQLKIDPELMKNMEYLLNSEAANILMIIQEQMIDLSKDSDIKLPVTFDKGLQYAKGSTQYTNTHYVRQVLQALKVHGVTDGEMCVLVNVCPETVDEVFALIPSLKPKWHVLREPLVNVLSGLAKHRKRT